MEVRRLVSSWIQRYSAHARELRGALFRELLSPRPQDTILDLGSEEGDHIAAIVPFRDNVTIADIDPEALARGRSRYGFQTAVLDETGRLPFADAHFDIVFCSSVIEHVTLEKDALARVTCKRAFAEASFARQQQFAAEIRRVSKRYFVQTPSKWFPIESHTWMPLPIVLLPRSAQLRLVAWCNGWWIKPTQMDWNLLTARSLAQLFPDADIERESVLGVTKSLIAVRR